MKKNRGFTLFELLAAIVILAVILVITIPTVNNILTSSKIALLKVDAEEIISSIKKQNAMDRHFDITSIDINNMGSVLGVGTANYKDITVQWYGDDVYIYVTGAGKWEGLYAYGTSQNITVGNTDLRTYYVTDTTYEYTTATHELIMDEDDYLTNGCDDCFGELTLPFSFNFGGKLYWKFYISSNGKIVLSKDITYYPSYIKNVNMNYGGPSFPVIGLYWADLYIDKEAPGGAGIFYDFGTEDGKEYVLIEYRNVLNFGQGGSVEADLANFETKIYEDGVIKVFYDDTEFGDYEYNYGADAELGVRANELNYAQYSYREASLTDNDAIMYDLNVGVTSPVEPTVPDNTCFNFDTATNTILDYSTDPSCPRSLIVPATINDVAVNTIGEAAFAEKGLYNVVISNGIVTVDAYAFTDNLISKLTIPNSVTTINRKAFEKNYLTSVTIPSSVIYIDEGAFNNNFFPDSTAYIYKRNPDGSIDNTTVMSYAGAKKDVTNMPSNITTIAPYAFSSARLSSVVISNNVTTIGHYAFDDNEISSVSLPNKITTINEGTFWENNIRSLTIPNSITVIDASAFHTNSIETLVIPNTVTFIGEEAFESNHISSLSLSNNLTFLGGGVFNNNELSDANAFIYARNPDKSIDNTTLTSYGGTKKTGVVIPGNVTKIADHAFTSSQLVSVTIPSSVTSIGSQSFAYNSLTSITIPSSVTIIKGAAFYKNQLATATINNGVIVIEDYAFSENKLTEILIPNSVTGINHHAFEKNLITQGNAKIDNTSGSVTIVSGAFDNNGSDGLTTITPTYLR